MLKVPCPQCGKVPPPDCDCPPLPEGPPDPPVAEEPGKKGPRREVIKLRRERRRGRDVIVVHEIPDDVDLGALAKTLKTRCATGGTVKGATIEIQGDHRDAISAVLLEQGFRSRRSGG